jgi:tRNA threonylcarbamoyladenosine biosynthesis protein TsaE
VTRTVLELRDPGATERLGRELSRILATGDTVFLDGELGAGKTTLVRSILQGMGWSGAVRSPSYALVHSYPTLAPPVHHLDLYRLGSAEEALGLDLDQYARSGAILLVEWPDRLEGSLRPRMSVRLEITGPESRKAEIVPSIDAYIDERIIAQGATQQ